MIFWPGKTFSVDLIGEVSLLSFCDELVSGEAFS